MTNPNWDICTAETWFLNMRKVSYKKLQTIKPSHGENCVVRYRKYFENPFPEPRCFPTASNLVEGDIPNLLIYKKMV